MQKNNKNKKIKKNKKKYKSILKIKYSHPIGLNSAIPIGLAHPGHT